MQRLRNQPLSSVIALTSNAEDLFEEYGIDYWFGCHQTLAAACVDAEVDIALLLRRLRPTGGLQPRGDVTATVDALASDFDTRIHPAIIGVERAAVHIHDARSNEILAMLDVIETLLFEREQALRNHVAPGLETGKPLDAQCIRGLALQHRELVTRINGLLVSAEHLAADGLEGTSALLRTAHQLAREIHHHIRVSFADVVPQLVRRHRAMMPR